MKSSAHDTAIQCKYETRKRLMTYIESNWTIDYSQVVSHHVIYVMMQRWWNMKTRINEEEEK